MDRINDILNVLSNDLRDIEHEVVIVDNGSTDGTQDLATIANENNMGISIGKNQCIDNTTGDFLLLLDGDIVPVPNSINLLLEHMENNEHVQALGFKPNKFTNQRNNDNGQKHHEDYCDTLFEVEQHDGCIIYYGMFRREVFDVVRMDETGEFGGVGYGYEDWDLSQQMIASDITQWRACLNTVSGKYYHNINSSIREMGREKYIETSLKRHKQFQEKWSNVTHSHT